jgi:hypothetical protein
LGNYTILNIPPNFYQVIAWATVYYDTARNGVTIEPAKTETLNIPLTPINRGGIEGQVVSTDSTVVSGAIVVTLPPTDTVATNLTGNYRINNVIPGSYQVFLINTKDLQPPLPDSAYYSGVVDTVLVKSGQSAAADFILDRIVWWDFDNDPLGGLAQGWIARRGRWFVNDSFPPGKSYYGDDTSTVGPSGSTIPSDPAHTYDDFSLSLDLLVSASSPQRGKSDVFFRWQDDLHHYKVSLADSQVPGQIMLYKVQGGSPTLLSSANMPFGRAVWHGVVVYCVGQTIETWVDGTRRIQVNDNAFRVGRVALGTSGRGRAFFDNVRVVH